MHRLTSCLDLQLVTDVLELGQGGCVRDLHVHGRAHRRAQVRRAKGQVAEPVQLRERESALLDVIGCLEERRSQ